MNLWWGKYKFGGESTGGTFPGGGGVNKFLASGEGTRPIPPSRESLVHPKNMKDFKPPIWISLPRGR